MKNLIYTLVLFFVVFSANASNDPSLWDPVNGEKASKFDNWIEIRNSEGVVTNIRPFGWYTSSSGAGAASVYEMRPTADRNGVPDAACRANIDGIQITWATWYTQTRTNHNDNSKGDINPLYIEKNTDFYYTFWAKADVAGMQMHIGPEELWNPDNYKPSDPSAWGRMPSVTLTTQWTKYGILISGRDCFRDAVYFNIHWRSNGVRYIDDIELRAGTELPPDVGSIVVNAGIFEYTSEYAPITVIASENGTLTFSSLAGKVSVYDINGRLAAQKDVSEGINYIQMETKGLYLLRYTSDGKSAVVKAIVK